MSTVKQFSSAVSFRLTYSVCDLQIPVDTVHTFRYGGPHDVLVQLNAPSTEQQAKGYKPENAFCTSSLRMHPNEKNAAVFAEIAANKVLPADATEWEVGCSYVGPNGGQIRIPDLSGFPEHFRDFVGGARTTLSDYAERTIAVFRWRANQPGPHSPIGAIDWSWSTDELFWHPAPSRTTVIGDLITIGRVTPQIIEQVRQLVSSGLTEPIGHEIYREADTAKWSNPRSAIVMGMAAAELATKHCIVTLVPETEWIVMNLPMPPLVQMLTDLLPSLPAPNRFDGVVKPPPREVIAALKKGVTIRNQLVHAGSVKPSSNDAIELLRAVRDLLWLLDYYGGNVWALEYIRHDTLNALRTL